jgi:hypothetical protein
MHVKRLLFVRDVVAAEREIARAGGAVVIRLTRSVVVAFLPSDAGVASFAEEEPPEWVDAESREIASAWRVAEETDWAQGGGELDEDGSDDLLPPRDLARATTAHIGLRGSVAVRTWIVGASGGRYAFDDKEKAKVREQAVAALTWLGARVPPGTVRFQTVWTESILDVPPYGSYVVPGVSLSGSPSTVMFGTTAWCFHRARDGRELLFTTSADGITWSGDLPIPEVRMSESPSAVVFRQRLYCFYRDASSEEMKYVSTGDGAVWSAPQRVPGLKMSKSPAAAVLADTRLYCFCRGRTSNHLLYTWTEDLQEWRPEARVPGAVTTQAPAAIELEKRLYVLHQGSESNDDLRFTSTADGTTWEPDEPINDIRLTDAPGLCIWQERLYCFYRRTDGTLRYTSTAGGRKWEDSRTALIELAESPSPIVIGGVLRCLTHAADSSELRNARIYDSKYEQGEAPWRDPALEAAGFRPGKDGIIAATEQLIQQEGTDWGYLAFITKYPLGHSAYASSAGHFRYIVVKYKSEGLNRSFAHETGHVFGAADEYSSSDCTCDLRHDVPNLNCENCGSVIVDCVMNHSDLAMCEYSRGQVGWPIDGVVVAFQGANEDGRLRWLTANEIGFGADTRAQLNSISDAPALAWLQPTLYCLRQERGRSGKLVVATSDGYYWSADEVVPGVKLSDAPGTAVLGTTLYCFFHRAGSNGELWYVTTSGAGAWSQPLQVRDVRMSESPAAVLFGTRLYCFYQHRDGGQLAYVSTDGASWEGEQKVPRLGMSASPAACVWRKRLYVFHHGSNRNRELWFTSSSDGVAWEPDQRVQGVRLSDSPAAVVDPDDQRLRCFHRGPGNSELRVTGTRDGVRWEADETVPGVGMSASPAALLVAPLIATRSSTTG